MLTGRCYMFRCKLLADCRWENVSMTDRALLLGILLVGSVTWRFEHTLAPPTQTRRSACLLYWLAWIFTTSPSRPPHSRARVSFLARARHARRHGRRSYFSLSTPSLRRQQMVSASLGTNSFSKIMFYFAPLTFTRYSMTEYSNYLTEKTDFKLNK